MSDAAIANLVTGLVTVVTLIVGFLTLWIKLKYGVESKVTAAAVAAKKTEEKLDANTAKTNEVDAKANTIVEQTNGTSEKTRTLIESISERVSKIEQYNHASSHKLANVLNLLHLKVSVLIEKYHPELNDIVPLPKEQDNH